MRTKSQLPSLLFLLSTLILFHFFPFTFSKSVIEPCTSSDSCPSLLSYHLPWDSKLSEIAFRFQLNISQILASNNMKPTTDPSLWDKILPAKSLITVPIPCPCVDGIRRSVSTRYSIRASDTLDLISEGFGGLVSPQQIRSVNGIKKESNLMTGESIVIPLPCTCFENSDNGMPAVYLSYVVENGDSLKSIGDEYGSTVSNLESINGLGQNPQVYTGDILAIPIAACSSANLNWKNESLIVPNGSYSLTANNCIRCSCASTDHKLECMPSGIATSCSHLQCKGYNLFIGDIAVNKTVNGCNVTACMYRGHFGRKIFRSLEKYSHVECSGNPSYAAESPLLPPTAFDSSVPYLASSPSSYSTSYPLKQTGDSYRITRLLPMTWHLFLVLVCVLFS